MSGSASFHKVGSLVPLLISRTGGFPNSRLYSRLNYEGAFIADATAYHSIIFPSFRRMLRAS